MSAFTFDFDLEDDLDESFDAIPLQGPAAATSVDKTLKPERASGGEEIPAEEIPLSALVSPIYTLSFLAALLPSRPNKHPIGQRSSPRSPKRSHTRL